MRNIAAQRQEFIASKSSPPSNFASAMLKKALPKLIDRKQGKSSFPADVKPPANVSKPYTDPAWEDEVDAGAILTMTSVAPLAVLNAALVKQRGTDSGAPSDAPLGFSPVSTLTPRYADGYKGVQQDVQESVAWNKHHAKEFFSLLRCVRACVRDDLHMLLVRASLIFHNSRSLTQVRRRADSPRRVHPAPHQAAAQEAGGGSCRQEGSSRICRCRTRGKPSSEPGALHPSWVGQTDKIRAARPQRQPSPRQRRRRPKQRPRRREQAILRRLP